MQQRLSQYLKALYPDLSSRILKRALEQGACLINGKIERYGSRMIDTRKDKINFTVVKPKSIDRLTIKKEKILFEDDFLIAYDKEAGHSALATEGKNANLHEELKKFLKIKFLQPAHRLDKNTSGIMLFAKDGDTLQKLSDLFAEKKINKEYQAIIDGKWSHSKKGVIDTFVELEYKRGSTQKWKVSTNPHHKQAITNYELIKEFDNYSLLKLEPLTGRTHQLRIHMAHMKHPILGDTVYAKSFRSKAILARHLLHAHLIKFMHPQTSQNLTIKAPLPEDMKKLLG
ncbi:MAG: RluA family pseudouridine synthase [Candidatus Caenarcaniphilales bacterium]|jgi:RluA family pseudouridine synthase|nr:RluA family pseudouridine synthase [Candidatus Caenarcaniphilales bacterium]